jgi:RNA polymerase sigma-70 factor (ECF subfamily)
MKLAAEIELVAFGEVAPDAERDFEQIYQSYGGAVLRWARHLAGPTLDAEEIAQEVFLRAYRNRNRLRGQVSPSTRLYRMTAAIVAVRRNRERRRERLASLLQSVRAFPERTPLESLEQEQERALIYQVLDSMRERDRTLLIAFAIEEMSGREIADVFGLKIGTVWTWLSRARVDFRRRMVNRGLVSRKS